MHVTSGNVIGGLSDVGSAHYLTTQSVAPSQSMSFLQLPDKRLRKTLGKGEGWRERERENERMRMRREREEGPTPIFLKKGGTGSCQRFMPI